MTDDQERRAIMRAFTTKSSAMLKLEVGKLYRTRRGEVRGPLWIDKRYPDRFTDERGNWYGDDGHFWQQPPDCPFALVAEAN